MDNENNISPTGPGNESRLKEDRLLAYLEGRLSPAEQHEVELWLADEGMESDAQEGLGAMQAAERNHAIERLNHKLRKTIVHKSRKRKKLVTDSYVLVAVFLILLLIAVGYLVIRYAR